MGELLQQNPDLTLREFKAALGTALSIQTLGPHDAVRVVTFRHSDQLPGANG